MLRVFNMARSGPVSFRCVAVSVAKRWGTTGAKPTGDHIIIWDIETTGLNKQFDQVIEIAAYHPLTGSAFNRMVRPTTAKMNPEALAVHGIEMDILKGEAVFREVWGDFQAWVTDCCSEGEEVLMLSHYAHSLDVPLTMAELIRSGKEAPVEWVFADTSIAIKSYFRTAKAKDEDFVSPAKYNLGSLCKHLDITIPTHRALDDTKALWTVLSTLFPGEDGFKKLSGMYKLKKKPKTTTKTGAKTGGKGHNGMWWKWRKTPKKPVDTSTWVTAKSA
eukprot:TRINITY_DN4374_c0_g3_i1.p1 TRINITY_DN4374_c0_g3~~TRINITY_DN4374_c0_g3_i1.p1  ORF type:complete len:288 (+),score=46.10 TRINITY_DN4374_c0_g3_i1:42-866(+)